jgi:hypothetical protein
MCAEVGVRAREYHEWMIGYEFGLGLWPGFAKQAYHIVVNDWWI